MPRELPEALLEGLAWDGMERRYATLSDVRSYSARVASAVGAMMCVLMRVRDPRALARACDLGVAMQLTNIARDVGEDARAGRLYLPTDWLDEAGIDIDAFLADPKATPELRRIVRRLLAEANRLYIRSEAGIKALPLAARPGIFAARHCYDAIGRNLARNDHDSVSCRAYTTRTQKLGLLGLSVVRAGMVTVFPTNPVLYAKPLPEVAFLVEAAAHPDTAKTAGARTSFPCFRSWKRVIAHKTAWRGPPDTLSALYGLGIVRDFSRRLRGCSHDRLDVHAGRVVSFAVETAVDTAELDVPGGLDDALYLLGRGRRTGRTT